MNEENLENLILEAKNNNQLFPIKKILRLFCLISGILCCVLIFTIPLGVMMLMIYFRPFIAVTNEGVVIRLISTKMIRWNDFEGFRLAKEGKITSTYRKLLAKNNMNEMDKTVQAKKHLEYNLKDQDNWHSIPTHLFDRPTEILSEFENRTGCSIFS